MEDLEIRAVCVSARLEIYIPYPQKIKDQIDADNAAINSAMAAAPEWARAFAAPHLDLNPVIQDWIAGLDAAALRSECARKAKKIGLTIPKPEIFYSYNLSGVIAYQTATGRA